MPDRVFDRLVHYDNRSLEYPVRPLLAPRGVERPFRAMSYRGVQTDQGFEGACAGHGVTQEAAARPVTFFGDPVRNPPTDQQLNLIAYEVYREAQTIDPWKDQPHEGTSVLAAMEIGRKRGFWSEYRWALGPGAENAARDVLLALGYKGPVIMGSDWLNGMRDADENGFLHATGRVAGGHCYLLTRVRYVGDWFHEGRANPRNWAVWTPNSWGGEGQGWIIFDDLVLLLRGRGEAAIPTARLMPAK